MLLRPFRSEAHAKGEAAEGRRADFEIRASERDFRKRRVDGKVFYRRCGKDSFQVHGNDFFLTRDKE